MAPGRNDPCPCGSGKKYKKCCMLADEVGSDQISPRLINRASEEAFHALLSFARRTRGDAFLQDLWQTLGVADPSRRRALELVVLPWAVYLWDSGSGTVAEECLAGPAGRRLSARARDFARACTREPLTYWQVQAVERGAGMDLRDLVSGREVSVHERSATESVVRSDILFGQVVEVDGIHTLSATGPYVLPPDRFRSRLQRFLSAEIDPQDARGQHEELLAFYLGSVDELFDPPRPEVRNTEGDRLEATTSTYRFEPESRGRLLGRLDQMRNIEAVGEEGEEEFVWVSQGRRGPMEQVTRARLEVRDDTLVTDCNSRKRDRLLRDRLTKSLGDLLAHVETTHEPLDWDGVDSAPESEDGSLDMESLPPEVQEQMQRMLDDMHMRWADEQIPALGGRTPREAVRTEEGRREVVQLLDDFESRSRHAAYSQDRFDYNRLRRELGIDPE